MVNHSWQFSASLQFLSLQTNSWPVLNRFFPVDPGNISFEEFSKTIDDMKGTTTTTTTPAVEGIMFWCGAPDRAVSPPPIITKVAKTLVGKPPPKKKVLNSQLKEMKFKHRRDPLGPTDAYQRPLTQNMEYGWDTMVYPGESAVPVHERKRHFPKGQTDVTAGGEGLTLETYYGVEYIRI
ncbi:hypothetical protein AXG93_4689s1480 [Marchantia polymorpha subsp. ruderalis]|uniref:Uncharacterized protein n=1 Tax=Marchantia polymorpha subsp. ruderalis TaxID=1480154 RepID=A0A176WLZ1_MARPO|nr:hypothetical protein AXG93_4689s1480 [Marchantia polymorpha subsp. ruderalis]